MTDESTLQRLLDIEAIKALKARYCWYCDDPDQLPPVPRAVHRRRRVHRGAASTTSRVKAGDRGVEPVAIAEEVRLVTSLCDLTPLIEVADDGQTATGRWQALLLSIQNIDGAEQMLWASGTYLEEYRKVEGAVALLVAYMPRVDG